MRAGLAGVAALVACVLAACGGVTPSSAPKAVAASGSPAAVPAGLEQFYDQQLQWYPCDDGDDVEQTEDGTFLCAVAEVPRRSRSR